MEIKIICRRGFRLQTSQILVISRSSFAEDDNEMYTVLTLFCPLYLSLSHVVVAATVLVYLRFLIIILPVTLIEIGVICSINGPVSLQMLNFIACFMFKNQS